jgi:hypothetical protein
VFDPVRGDQKNAERGEGALVMNSKARLALAALLSLTAGIAAGYFARPLVRPLEACEEENRARATCRWMLHPQQWELTRGKPLFDSETECVGVVMYRERMELEEWLNEKAEKKARIR